MKYVDGIARFLRGAGSSLCVIVALAGIKNRARRINQHTGARRVAARAHGRRHVATLHANAWNNACQTISICAIAAVKSGAANHLTPSCTTVTTS